MAEVKLVPRFELADEVNAMGQLGLFPIRVISLFDTNVSSVEIFVVVFDGPGGGNGGVDPYWDNVVLLAHYNSDFSDSSQSVHSASVGAGTPAIDDTIFKFGPGSLDLDGSSDVAYSGNLSDFNFSTIDFTIEAWIYIETDVGNLTIASIWPSGANAFFFEVNRQLNNLVFGVGGTGGIQNMQIPWEAESETWYHVAISRVGNSYHFFVDGTLIGTVENPRVINDATSNLLVGRREVGPHRFVGKIDEVRFTKGVGRYTENFTPPDSPFPETDS